MTLLPEPVAPAMRICFMETISPQTGLPSMLIPMVNISELGLAFLYSSACITVRMLTGERFLLGTSMEMASAKGLE